MTTLADMKQEELLELADQSRDGAVEIFEAVDDHDEIPKEIRPFLRVMAEAFIGMCSAVEVELARRSG